MIPLVRLVSGIRTGSDGSDGAAGFSTGADGFASAFAGAAPLSSIVPTTSPIFTSAPAGALMLKMPAFFRGDLRRNFVGFKREQRFARCDGIAVVFVPDGEEAAGDRFADGWDFDFERHGMTERWIEGLPGLRGCASPERTPD